MTDTIIGYWLHQSMLLGGKGKAWAIHQAMTELRLLIALGRALDCYSGEMWEREVDAKPRRVWRRFRDAPAGP